MEYEDEEERRIFGVPAVLAVSERNALLGDLTLLWELTYADKLGSLGSDLDRCRQFFDPVMRGITLRERLARLRPTAADVASRMQAYGEPLVVDVGDGVLLVGLEARLTIELLKDLPAGRAHAVISRAAASNAERAAMEVYRTWTLNRLRQVVDLRSGLGKEVMQAVAVGVVLALLVNGSDSPDRAVQQRNSATADAKDIDRAIFACADKFAEVLTARRSRSSSEQRLKGGYGLTEARRRLAHRLVVAQDPTTDGIRMIYIPREYWDEVIAFLGKDLARRPTLTAFVLEEAFDELVSQFRIYARNLAYRSMVFEHPAETSELKENLLHVFVSNRGLE